MAEVEIPEEEIQLLKTAFQFCVQETLSSIAGLTIYTAGYLRAQLEDDAIIGPRWGTIQGDPRDAERALLDVRLADMEHNPDDQSPWPEVKARVERLIR